VCIQNFMYEMELKPGSKRNMLAMTGVITSTSVKNTLITILQVGMPHCTVGIC
jgi:chitin synthase